MRRNKVPASRRKSVSGLGRCVSDRVIGTACEFEYLLTDRLGELDARSVTDLARDVGVGAVEGVSVQEGR